jgi:hypothetical protein
VGSLTYGLKISLLRGNGKFLRWNPLAGSRSLVGGGWGACRGKIQLVSRLFLLLYLHPCHHDWSRLWHALSLLWYCTSSHTQRNGSSWTWTKTTEIMSKKKKSFFPFKFFSYLSQGKIVTREEGSWLWLDLQQPLELVCGRNLERLGEKPRNVLK